MWCSAHRVRVWPVKPRHGWSWGGTTSLWLLAATGYPFGITQAREYAEPEWYADLVLTIAWVAYLILYLRTLARRAEPHIYVANWYYLGFIVVIAMLHVVNNLAMPVSIAYPKSYSLFAGVQDAMTQWWYGHNAVGFLLTSGFLGMMYYFLPKAVGRPIYSYRMSIIGFWGSPFFTFGLDRTICITPPCQIGCNTLA